MTTVHYKLVQTDIRSSQKTCIIHDVNFIIATIRGISGIFEKHNWSKIEHNWERPTHHLSSNHMPQTQPCKQAWLASHPQKGGLTIYMVN